ncbi:MAG: DUF885 domain-containing protein [Candidatus Saliniplasma sp.]
MVKEADKKFEELEKDIFDKFMKRNPTFATHLGIHEYDHLLPDISREKHLKDIELIEDWKDELKKFDANELSKENDMARKLGLHLFDLLLFQMKELKEWKKNPAVPSVVGGSIFPLIKRDFASIEERLNSIHERIKGIPEMVEQEKTKLEDPVKLWIDMAIESAEQLPMLMKLVIMIAQDAGIGEEKLIELKGSVEKADAALDEYIEWLEDKRTESVEEFAIGPEKFEELIEKRELDYSPDEILKVGEELLEEAKDEMRRYAEKIDKDADVQEVVEQVMSQTPDNFDDALEWYREGLKEAKNFVIENDLATVPQDEEIEVAETPEYLRPIIPYAAYMPPAKFDEVKKGIYIVTPPQNEDALTNYSYWDVRNTTVHEGYPGHHLQNAAAMTNDDVFHLFSRAIETIEGWAHYCEEMMKEHGFDDTPEARLIQTKDVVWRAARIIVDVKLSRGDMSFDEAVEFLVDEAGLKEKDAIAEVKRYTQNPAYQLSYLLGKEMLKDLKKDVKSKMGDDYTEKFFHDTILYAGSVPMKYLREIFENKLKTP